jgi:predicted O-linked N-acetylglucosamine transferase (SPINDLY family)
VRLHIHMVLAIPFEDDPRKLATKLKQIRAALRGAGGDWPKGARRSQVKMKPDPDEGWVGYLSKEFWKTTRFMRELLQHSRLFGVAGVTCCPLVSR